MREQLLWDVPFGILGPPCRCLVVFSALGLTVNLVMLLAVNRRFLWLYWLNLVLNSGFGEEAGGWFGGECFDSPQETECCSAVTTRRELAKT